jgi:hypothetical protein
MSDGTNLYAPYVNPVALDSMPLVTSDGAVTHGSDPAAGAPNPPPQGSTVSVSNWVGNILDSVPLLGPAASAGVIAGTAARSTPQSTQISQTVIWSVVLVVVGLLLLSRGFGLIGEEGEGVIVNLSNPSKYPGIGHAIQGMKKGEK